MWSALKDGDIICFLDELELFDQFNIPIFRVSLKTAVRGMTFPHPLSPNAIKPLF